MNKSFLTHIRANSCYPTYRILVVCGLVCGRAGAALFAVWGLVSTLDVGVFLLHLIGAALMLVAVELGREILSMLADIADATIRIAAGPQDISAAPLLTPDQIPKSP